ncbi:hypothetical protein EXA21_04705 [Vibrio cincinnatiensis]|uniref:hypothetical protein n=1 Tax=Vibrio cincinnatiensis TaxID=675 RepID=UPI001EDE71C7|nr:hypothetical protein [Vibrio cincinnatiensis]MCG3758856.1 hypothetical protein [Vibrio cincinnatiensis]MCG3762206.1 hypothetical protein [Vibrio cincinnatiensis]
MELISKFGPHEVGINQNALLYAVGAIDQSDKARKNITAHRCGFFVSDFQEWKQGEEEKLENAEQLTPVRVKAIEKHIREAAARSAGDNRLVKGRKSRTSGKEAFKRYKLQSSRLHALKKSIRGPLVLNPYKYHSQPDSGTFAAVSRGVILNSNNKKSLADKKPVVKIQLQTREWSQQTRLIQVIETPAEKAPAENSGDRFTEKLTARAVKNIFESGAYVAVKHGGFKTFLTLTFDEDRRRRVLDGTDLTEDGLFYSPVGFVKNFAVSVNEVAGPYTAIEWYRGKIKNTTLMNENGEIAGPYSPVFAKPEKLWRVVGAKTTIGAEVSGFINALKKARKRGFKAYVTERDSESGRLYCPFPKQEACVMPEKSDFHYMWVAECPANEGGEPNPHVHLLMDWDMTPELFTAWAEKIESLWGNGFANLQRIKKPEAAGTYIIKAVGYAAKGDKENQGIIRGNRYGMAACTRAPKWETLTSFEADNMAGIICELGHKLDRWKKPILRSIKRAETLKEQSIKAAGIAKAKNDVATLAKLKNRIARLENQIKNARAETKAAGMHVSAKNRFCITFDKKAEIRINQFLKWAAGARGWSMTPLYNDVDLSDIKEAAQVQYQNQYQEFIEKRAYWEAVKRDPFEPVTISREEFDRQNAHFWSMYEQASVFYH